MLEDIQWADPSTLALLAFLARNLRAERLVVLATYRVDDELAPALRRLAASSRGARVVRRIELAPLAPRTSRASSPRWPGERVPATLARELHARAGGNPFFVEELYAARTDTLTEAVLARVARLDDDMLAVLAAVGGPALARAAGAARGRAGRVARGRSTRACSCACPTGSRSGTA